MAKRLPVSFYEQFDTEQEEVLADKEYPVFAEVFSGTRDKVIVKSLEQKSFDIYQKLGSIYNPFLENVLDAFQESGQHYAVTNYIRRPLDAEIIYRDTDPKQLSLKYYVEHFAAANLDGNAKGDAKRYIPEKAALQLIYHICEGLEALNKLGNGTPIIHGDIAPQNIMLTDKPKWLHNVSALNDPLKLMPVVIDFGTTKWADLKEHPLETQVQATMDFVAPEIIGIGPSDRMDIYSLGCLLYYMMYGKSPKKTAKKDLKKQVSKKTFCVITKCLKDYKQRYKNLRELERDIIKALK